MPLDLTIEGAEVITAKLRQMGEQGLVAAATALTVEAEMIMAESKARYVPVDTGVLRASGVVAPPQWDERDSVSVRMGYGGAAEDYALIQHERLDYRHAVGSAKFLEIPLMDAARGMAERLSKAFKVWG